MSHISRNKKERAFSVFLFFSILVVLILMMTPFYWVVSTSLKFEKDIISRPVKYLPDPFTFDNYINSWNNIGFNRYFLNSFLVSIITCFVVLAFSILVAYPLTRFHFRGKKIALLLLLCTQFLPHSMLLIPLFIIFRFLGLINTHMSLIMSYITFSLPFNAILMRGFMAGIPVSLEEAAMIDGCGRIKAIYKVILPLLVPGVVACGSFAFIDAWKEFLFAVMFINDPERMTIPVGLSYMLGEFTINYGILAAGAIIAIIPPLIIFAFIQKYLIKGLSAGAVKG
jgi:multiple sugar transport system permease protein